MRFRFLRASGSVPWRAFRSSIAIGALLAAQLGFAVAPAAAAPPAIVVSADLPSAVPTGHFWSFDDFFPRTLTVAQGSTIGFAIEGFHTATLLPAGVTAAQDLAAHPFVAPDGEDTAPNPNGSTHSQLVLPAVFNQPATGCGTDTNPCAFDGTSVVSAGAPLGGPPSGPFDVTITAAPGTYAFHCRIHPLMTGTLNVVAVGGPATTPAELSTAVAAQSAADVAAGRAAEAKAEAAGVNHNADGTTTWTLTAGTSSPDGRTVVLEMLPRTVNVRPGDSVKWVARGTNEIHTVTFPHELNSDLLPLCENGATDTPAIPKNNPPQGPFDFGCGSGPADEFENGGGNGVTTITSPTTIADSGIIAPAGMAGLFGVPDTSFPTTWAASFTAASAGTYTYLCEIHGKGMSGTIRVLAAPASRPPTANATPPATTTGSTGTVPSAPALPLPLVLGLLAILGALATGGLILRKAR